MLKHLLGWKTLEIPCVLWKVDGAVSLAQQLGQNLAVNFWRMIWICVGWRRHSAKDGFFWTSRLFWTPRNCYLCFFRLAKKKDGHSLIHFEVCVVRLLSKRHSSVWDLCKSCDHLSTPNINECPWKKTVSKGKDHLPLPSFFWCELLILCWETLALNWSPFPWQISVARFSATCFLLENLSLEKTGRIVWPGRGAWVMRWGRPGFRRAPCRGDWLHFGSETETQHLNSDGWF